MGNAARLYAIVLLDEMLTLHVGQDATLPLQHARTHIFIDILHFEKQAEQAFTDVLLSPTSANTLRNTINMTPWLQNPYRVTLADYVTLIGELSNASLLEYLKSMRSGKL